MRSDARRGRALHAVVERAGFRRSLSVLSTYILHNVRRKRSRSHDVSKQSMRCAPCSLFWLPSDCPFVNCVDVAIDWPNIVSFHFDVDQTFNARVYHIPLNTDNTCCDGAHAGSNQDLNPTSAMPHMHVRDFRMSNTVHFQAIDLPDLIPKTTSTTTS